MRAGVAGGAWFVVRKPTVWTYVAGGAMLVLAGTSAGAVASAAAAPPRVSSVATTSGPAAGGGVVTIRGTGFSHLTRITFGTTTAIRPHAVSSTQVTAVVPAHAAGTVDVRVTTTAATSPVTVHDRYTYVAPAVVTSVTPASGPAAGGGLVTIRGTGFGHLSRIAFGTTTAIRPHAVSSTQLTAVVPAHAAGTVDVRVTIGTYGTSAVTVRDRYTYVAPAVVTSVTPASGPAAGGGVVTVRGTGFGTLTRIAFGTTTALQPHVVSSTQLTAVVPAHAPGIVDVRVTIGAFGTSAITVGDRYTYVAPPPPPPATTVLTATATAPDVIDLAWSNAKSTAVGVTVRRSVGPSAPAAPDDGVLVAAPGAGVTILRDAHLDPEQTYSYALFASGASPTDSPLAVATAALPRWSAQTLPLDVDGPGGASANSVQCFTDGTCVAVGSVGDADGPLQGSSHSRPMVSVRTDGRWATQVLTPPVGTDHLGLGPLSCVTSRYCVALGSPARAQATVVATLRDGRWTSTVIPSPSEAFYGMTLRAVSCVAVDVCRAVGSYTDSRDAPHFVTEVLTDGTWERSEIPVPAVTNGNPVITDFACATSTECLASGSFYGTSGATAFVEHLSGAQWDVNVIDTPGTGYSDGLGKVSCSDGSCTAWGSFAPSTGADHLYVVQPAGSGWQTVVLPDLPGRYVAHLDTVSCPAPAPEGCSLIADGVNSGNVLLTYNQSAWTVSDGLIGPRGTSVAGFFDLSCPAADRCTLVGEENTGRGGETAFAIDVTGNVQRPQQIPALNPAGSLSEIDCPTVGMCLATGSYSSYTGAGGSLARMLRDGRWVDVDLPVPPSDSYGFGAVSCPTTTFCAVAGAISGPGGSAGSGLVDTWDGSIWTTTSLGVDYITDLDCPAAGTCFAVGTEYPPGPEYHPSVQIALALRDGVWTHSVLPLPTPAADYLRLLRIACADTTHCTAVGRYDSPADAEMLVETMTAGVWTASTVPRSATAGRFETFTDVACPAVTQCVIAAQYSDDDGYVRDAVLTGTADRWTQQTLPTYGSAGRDVAAPQISCSSVGRCTIVDEYSEPFSTDIYPVVYTLTDRTWLMGLLREPDGAFSEIVDDVSCTTAVDCVAVGTAQVGVAQLPVALTFG